MTRQALGARGGRTGVPQRGAGGTGRAPVTSEERDKRGTPKKKEKQNTKTGQTEGTGPSGTRGKQGAKKGTNVHSVSCRETPCR